MACRRTVVPGSARVLVAAASCLLLAAPAHVALAKDGDRGRTSSPTAPSAAAAVASVAVSPSTIGPDSRATGTVRLNRVPGAPVSVLLSTDASGAPGLVTVPSSVEVAPPSASASFVVSTGPGNGMTRSVIVYARVPGGSFVTGRLVVVPVAGADLIDIPTSSISSSGDLRFTAVTDTPMALLTATFQGRPVPMTHGGGGRWSGRAAIPAPFGAGPLIVRSDLGGCRMDSSVLSASAPGYC